MALDPNRPRTRTAPLCSHLKTYSWLNARSLSTRESLSVLKRAAESETFKTVNRVVSACTSTRVYLKTATSATSATGNDDEILDEKNTSGVNGYAVKPFICSVNGSKHTTNMLGDGNGTICPGTCCIHSTSYVYSHQNDLFTTDPITAHGARSRTCGRAPPAVSWSHWDPGPLPCRPRLRARL